MVNFGAKILNNAVAGMRAQQAVIANTGNNIANVNTPGYTRRTVALETRSSGAVTGFVDVGNGVDVATIRRIADKFLEQALLEAGNDQASYGVQKEFLSRLDPLFTLTGEGNTIGSTLTSFFTAVQDLAANPASIELRSNLISRTNDLVNSVRDSFNQVAALQAEADTRIETELESVNSLTAQIAALNQSISQYEAAQGAQNNDDRDRRDELLKQLSEKISFTTVERADGALNIFLANGFTLVNGTTSRDLETTKTPSFGSAPYPPSLSGGILNYIVYDYDSTATTEHLDLTSVLKEGGGTIGGLLQLRGFADTSNTNSFQADGPLVAVASRIEALARTLLTTLNTEYLGPDRDGGTAGHQSSSGDLNGNNPSVYGLFTFEYSGARDVDGNGLPDDLSAAALGIDNFSSILQVTITDPATVAAARDQSGGPPAAAVYPPGDGSNMDALAALRTSSVAFGVGNYSFTGTFDQAYNESVTYVGNQARAAELSLSVAEDRYSAAATRRDETSAVSLDEEFANLIKYQKAFQASARMIKIASDLLDEMVRII